MLRWAGALLFALLAFSVAGIPAAASAQVDDCADACASEAPGDDADCSGTCPPLCDDCACVTFLGQALVVPVSRLEPQIVIDSVVRIATTTLPPSALGQAVFHPPRQFA